MEIEELSLKFSSKGAGMLKNLCLLISIFCMGCTTALADINKSVPDTGSLITPDFHKLIDGWLDTDVVRLSIAAQNERYGSLSQNNIDALDKQWRAERSADDKPLIAATLSSPLSIYLARVQGQSVGMLVEVFIMDKNGLNVGQSSITSDFWQGDEDKFLKTYHKGAGTVFVDTPEWDEKYHIWRVQVNRTITAKDNKTAIGAVTVEVNLTELARRQSNASKTN